MDLSEILDGTTPISFEWKGHEIKLEVYTAGTDRVTKEQYLPLQETLKSEASDYSKMVDYARASVPLLVKSWNLEYKGTALPLSAESLEPQDDQSAKVPDSLLFEIGNHCREVWEDPTNAAPSSSTSEAAEQQREQTAS